MANPKARHDIVIERLLPGGPQGKTRTYSDVVSLSHFLCRRSKYVSETISKHKKIIRSPNGRYYVIRAFNNNVYGTNEDVNRFYSKHRWPELDFQKSGLSNPPIIHVHKLTEKQKLAHLKKSEEIRDALGKIDSKFGRITKEAEGSKELEDLRQLLDI